jgi:site-specific DNA-methyltransferase (adenine-specific)
MAWKLYEGDCFDYLPLIEDKSIDMILCDLPYGTTACKWDTPLPLDELWIEYKRVIKDDGAIVLTATQPFTSLLVTSNPEMFKYEWIWCKSKPTDFIRAKLKPMGKHESILIFSKGSVANGANNNMNYYPQGLKKVDKIVKNHPNTGGEGLRGKSFLGRNETNLGPNNKLHLPQYIQEFEGYPSTLLNIDSPKSSIHPTQKPVKLFEYLIKTYTNEGDLVLDNCAGSGTTGVACENTNRNSILMEKEPEYCQIIHDCMKQAHELKLEARKQQTLNSFSGQQTLTSHTTLDNQ